MVDVSSVVNRGGLAPRMIRVWMRIGRPSGDTRDRLRARSACRTDTSTCSGYENARAGIDAGVQRIRQVVQGVAGREPFRRGGEAALAFRSCVEGSHHALQIDSAGRKLITRHRSVNRCRRVSSSSRAGCSASMRTRVRTSIPRHVRKGVRADRFDARASEQRRGFARAGITPRVGIARHRVLHGTASRDGVATSEGHARARRGRCIESALCVRRNMPIARIARTENDIGRMRGRCRSAIRRASDQLSSSFSICSAYSSGPSSSSSSARSSACTAKIQPSPKASSLIVSGLSASASFTATTLPETGE